MNASRPERVGGFFIMQNDECRMQNEGVRCADISMSKKCMSFRGSKGTVGIRFLKSSGYWRIEKNWNIWENGLPRQRARWLAMTGFSTAGNTSNLHFILHYKNITDIFVNTAPCSSPAPLPLPPVYRLPQDSRRRRRPRGRGRSGSRPS